MFRWVVDALKKMWLKPGDAVKVAEILAEAMKERGAMDANVMTVLANGLIRANDNLASAHTRLIETLPRMADATRMAGAQLVAPVGTSCTLLRQFSATPEEISITEPEAEVIRGGKSMDVDELREYRCKAITEVNRNNGHCIVELEELEQPVVGKITDPALQEADNVYTRALNDLTPVILSAKAVTKDGVMHRLFISDAQPSR